MNITIPIPEWLILTSRFAGLFVILTLATIGALAVWVIVHEDK